LKTKSRDAAFAAQKLDAVVTSYLALKTEAENARSSVRLAELHEREAELIARLTGLREDQLEVGGEFGMSAIAKAHVEKIAQIDALAARKSEVAATLAMLESQTGVTSADTSDQEIMRATLLDRAMADLNFERAKLMSELAGLRAGYEGQSNARFELKQKAKLDEIAVIEKALADRREQIRVLGQTGALTDATAEGGDDSAAEIRSLYEKIGGQLDTARREARDLNRRRIELDRIDTEIDEAQGLLEETRRALEVIRLESGRALPGYTVLMSPPSVGAEPAEDSRKLFAAGGFAGGGVLAFVFALALGLFQSRLRFAETLAPHEHRVPVLQVSEADDTDPDAADRLRNELQLQPLKRPRLVGKAPVIAVTRAVSGETTDIALALAESFARARMKTLFIDADILSSTAEPDAQGWREALAVGAVEPQRAHSAEDLWVMSAGRTDRIDDRTVSAPMVREALARVASLFDVVVVSTGSLSDRLSGKFVLSAADVGVLALRPSDRKSIVLTQLDNLRDLPRNGSVAAMRQALPGDPWLAVRT
jgi:Mrp family chromosome partitioning ATPase